MYHPLKEDYTITQQTLYQKISCAMFGWNCYMRIGLRDELC